jgi:hypothetical protein
MKLKPVFSGVAVFRILIRIFPVILMLLVPSSLSRYEYPLFRVVLDPGHGGQCVFPRESFGDRWDPISRRYLDDFREGAARGRITEQEIVYSIALKTNAILQNLAPGGDFKKFEKIARKYCGSGLQRINIITVMSREKGISREEADGKVEKSLDPNGPYRLFDYPDSSGNRRQGRISKINSFSPHLVVSLHLAGSAPDEYKGMNPILVAPYDFLEQGLRYLKKNITGTDFFRNNRMNDWFCENTRREAFQWFLSDVSQYFTGYPLDANLKIRRNRFKGYLYNMNGWAYSDNPGWENRARYHVPNSRYSMNFRNVVPQGKFWDRERSKYEKFRRDGGEEGFGGDNAYASYEIIRYILSSLKLGEAYHKSLVPGRPYVSTWIMPLHVNAINPFIELGYLNRRIDRYTLLNKQDEIAEGVAMGVYSLLAGMKPLDEGFAHAPRGKRIDLEKYRITNERSYFDAVWDR